jgi:hypothetical protein
VLLLVSVAGCGGDDDAAAGDGTGAAGPAVTDTPGAADAAEAAGSDDPSPYGSGQHGIGAEVVSVDDVAALGDGAAVGDSWRVWTGLNVCGQYLDPVPATSEAEGLTLSAAGVLDVAPVAGGPTGHEITVADLLELQGITASTGEISFPGSQRPQEVEMAGTTIAVAGRTLRTGDECGGAEGNRAQVQVWYYTPDAVESGRGVLSVVTDPQDVPIVADGSAVVVTLSPESSLPTLPPAALVG